MEDNEIEPWIHLISGRELGSSSELYVDAFENYETLFINYMKSQNHMYIGGKIAAIVLLFFSASCVFEKSSVLSLGGTGLKKIPESVLNRRDLTELYLGPKSYVVYFDYPVVESPNYIDSLPPGIGKLSRLKKLDLSFNQITDLSPVKSLKKLQCLILIGDSLLVVKNNIQALSQLRSLKYLAVIGARIDSSDIGKLQQLFNNKLVLFTSPRELDNALSVLYPPKK